MLDIMLIASLTLEDRMYLRTPYTARVASTPTTMTTVSISISVNPLREARCLVSCIGQGVPLQPSCQVCPAGLTLRNQPAWRQLVREGGRELSAKERPGDNFRQPAAYRRCATRL